MSVPDVTLEICVSEKVAMESSGSLSSVPSVNMFPFTAFTVTVSSTNSVIDLVSLTAFGASFTPSIVIVMSADPVTSG